MTVFLTKLWCMVYEKCWVLFEQEKIKLWSKQLTYFLTYLLTPWSRVLEKLTGCQLIKKFTAFTSTCPCPEPDQTSPCPPNPSSWSSIFIFSQLCLGIPSGFFPSGFPTKTLFTPLFSPLHATCFTLLILHFDHPNCVGWAVQIIKLCVM